MHLAKVVKEYVSAGLSCSTSCQDSQTSVILFPRPRNQPVGFQAICDWTNCVGGSPKMSGRCQRARNTEKEQLNSHAFSGTIPTMEVQFHSLPPLTTAWSWNSPIWQRRKRYGREKSDKRQKGQARRSKGVVATCRKKENMKDTGSRNKKSTRRCRRQYRRGRSM